MLVLQGGGALGSYQAGAFQALCRSGFEPEWVAGISIGAINAAIIAGNDTDKRVDRLKEFWEMVSSPVPWNPVLKGDASRSVFNETSAAIIATFGVPGFFTPRIPPAPLWPQGSPQALSYYDTAPLKKTLERLVDFDRINDLKCRLSGRRGRRHLGQFPLFRQCRIQAARQENRARAHHGLRRAAAGFSRGPDRRRILLGRRHRLQHAARLTCWMPKTDRDLLIFQVDLFSARGDLPETLLEAAEREKDIRYSSRTRMNTDKNRQIHNARKAVRDLISKLPDNLQDDPSVEFLREAAKENTVTVVHLIYKSKNYETIVQGLRLFPCRHGRALERRRPRRAFVDASQGMAGTAAVRGDHGDLRLDGGRSSRRQKGVKKRWVR